MKVLNETPAFCPECAVRLNYDTWEDCYLCPKCSWLFYPEEIGRTTDKTAGIFHIGETVKPS